MKHHDSWRTASSASPASGELQDRCPTTLPCLRITSTLYRRVVGTCEGSARPATAMHCERSSECHYTMTLHILRSCTGSCSAVPFQRRLAGRVDHRIGHVHHSRPRRIMMEAGSEGLINSISVAVTNFSPANAVKKGIARLQAGRCAVKYVSCQYHGSKAACRICTRCPG